MGRRHISQSSPTCSYPASPASRTQQNRTVRQGALARSRLDGGPGVLDGGGDRDRIDGGRVEGDRDLPGVDIDLTGGDAGQFLEAFLDVQDGDSTGRPDDRVRRAGAAAGCRSWRSVLRRGERGSCASSEVNHGPSWPGSDGFDEVNSRRRGSLRCVHGQFDANGVDGHRPSCRGFGLTAERSGNDEQVVGVVLVQTLDGVVAWASVHS